MWGRDAQRMKFGSSPGQRLRVRGRLGVYDRDGKMQLYADFAEPAGLGAEALALEQLKQKLAAEGMFAPEKKRPLPRFPRRIGVVTSKNGAAVHDIIRTVQRRLPTPILIADCGGAGPERAAPDRAWAWRWSCAPASTCVIVGRGGGAVTDLTAFNHERVVRTIARCPVPVISAVGHEVDLSLADLAADARASTPTAAAELARRRRRTRSTRSCARSAAGSIARSITSLDRARQDLDRATMALHARGERALARDARASSTSSQHRLAGLHPARADPRATAPRSASSSAGSRRRTPAADRARRHELETLVARRDAAMREILDERRGELGRLGAQMAALSPLAVLDRGYAMVQKDRRDRPRRGAGRARAIGCACGSRRARSRSRSTRWTNDEGEDERSGARERGDTSVRRKLPDDLPSAAAAALDDLMNAAGMDGEDENDELLTIPQESITERKKPPPGRRARSGRDEQLAQRLDADRGDRAAGDPGAPGRGLRGRASPGVGAGRDRRGRSHRRDRRRGRGRAREDPRGRAPRRDRCRSSPRCRAASR